MSSWKIKEKEESKRIKRELGDKKSRHGIGCNNLLKGMNPDVRKENK